MYICSTKPNVMYNKTKRLVISKTNVISIEGQRSSIPIGRVVSNFNNSLYVRILKPEYIYQCCLDDNNSEILNFSNRKQMTTALKSLYKF